MSNCGETIRRRGPYHHCRIPFLHPCTPVEVQPYQPISTTMPGELSRRLDFEPAPHEPEYVEINEQEQAIKEALQLARSLSEKLRHAVADTERQRAFRDLVAIIDNQLQEERAALNSPSYERQLRPADKQQFRRAFEYLNRTTHTIER